MLALITLLMVIGDILMLLFTRSVGINGSYSYANLSESWYIHDDSGFSKTPMSGEMQLSRGEEVSVHIPIPQSYSTRYGTCITFISYACALDLYSDGELIYSYGKDRLKEGLMLPRRVHYVYIPSGAHTKSIEIDFIGGKDGSSINPENSYFGDIEDLQRIFTQRRGYVFILSTALSAFGILLIVLGIYTGKLKNVSPTNITQGFLLMDLGTYIGCYNDTMYLFVRNDVVCTFIEYLSLLALPLLMQSVILTNRAKYRNPLHINVTIFDAVVLLAGVVLHITNVRHINTTSNFIHFLLLAHGIYSFVWVRHIINKERQKQRSYLYADAAAETIDFGLMSLLSMSLVNLYLWRQGIFHLDFLNSDVKGNFIILGSLIYTSCVILGYFFHSLGIEHEKEIKKALTEAAYNDEMTGTSNRAYCDQIMGLWDTDGSVGSVISLDLDGLKKINDELGHEAGDRYITAYAGLLKKHFAEDAVICRMGGDEFLVILKNYDKDACESIMYGLFDTVDEYNSNHPDMPIRFSAGMASPEDSDGCNIHELYRISDERMYEMKDQHHAEEKGGRA